MKNRTFYIVFFVASIFVLYLCSLHFGWLNVFFFGAEHAQVQGIDYFALPKTFLNLLEKRSMYDTWGGAAYGPYATWYLAHPAFAVFVMSWFSFFSPWTGYWLFVVFSFMLFTASAYVVSRIARSDKNKLLPYVFMLCAFPTYWTLFVGNMHAPLVLAITLIFVSIFQMTYSQDSNAGKMLLAGLLISFFTKPIVLLMLPVLLLVKETRKITFAALFIYIVISLVFVLVPLFNPQSIGWSRIYSTAFDIGFIKEHLNIYQNNFVLNEYMKDNSIHWFNLIAQSDYKLMHIDVFSLPVFIDTFVGHETAPFIYKIPVYICLLLSFLIPFVQDRKLRMESLLLLLFAISLTFFITYNTVWEYQYSSVLPLVALFPLLKEKNVFYSRFLNAMLVIGLIVCLPSFYFLFRSGDFQSAGALTVIRLTRVLPVSGLFLMVVVLASITIIKHAKLSRLSLPDPGKIFFE